MNPKYLKYLLVFCAFLAGGLFLSSPGSDASKGLQGKAKLLAKINPSKLSKVRVLRNGETPLVLSASDGQWEVDARGDYAADRDKVRGLILKLFDLPRSQRIPTDSSSFAALGVDDAEPQSQTDIVELYSSDKKLGAVILGQRRIDKQPDRAGRLSTSGQYVRLAGEDSVYLSSLPIDINTDPSDWIQADLLTVSEDLVFAVHQYVLLNGKRQKEFSLIMSSEISSDVRDAEVSPAKDAAGEDESASFVLEPKPAPGKKSEEELVSQVLAGLENVKIKDVAKVSKDPIVYDREIEFGLKSGLVYSIKSVELDGSLRAQISVAFDEGLAAQISKSGGADAESGNFELANQAKASELNDAFSSWSYTLAEYQAKKYRFLRSDLVTSVHEE